MLRGEPGTQVCLLVWSGDVASECEADALVVLTHSWCQVSLLLQRDGSTQEAIPIDVQRAEVDAS